MSEKLTLNSLKLHLRKAADILRGSLDASEYRQPVMTILFLKRLNDRFEENVEKLIAEGKSEKEANQDFRHDFFVPKDAQWDKLSSVRSRVGEKIDEICRIIEKANPKLDGVLTATQYSDVRKYPDDKLANLISHFNSPRLQNSDLEKEDIFGDAYEYLIEVYANATKKKGGEFFTPREVVKLLVNLTEPTEGMKICDPTCGSGGMLIISRRYVEKHKGNPRDLVLDGQESNYGNLAMCKMNMVLHGISDFTIEYGDTLSNPKLVEGGRLKTYDKVLANFPFSMDWDNSSAEKDPYDRFRFGIPPAKDKADFAFIQHMYSQLNKKGQAAIVCSQGIQFRGNKEKNIRAKMIDEDIIEGIINLPRMIFYADVHACILLLNKSKPKERKDKIIFIDASNEYEEGKVRNKLRETDVSSIVSTFKKFKNKKKYSYIATKNEIIENDYDLSVKRYLSLSQIGGDYDFSKIFSSITIMRKDRQKIEKIVKKNLEGLTKTNPEFLCYTKINDEFFDFLNDSILGTNKLKKITNKESKEDSTNVKNIKSIILSLDNLLQIFTKEINESYKIKEKLIQHLYSKGIGHVNFKETSIGKIATAWETKKIGEIAIEQKTKYSHDIDAPVLSVTKHKGIVKSTDYFRKIVHSKDLKNYKLVERDDFAYSTIHIDEGSIGLLDAFDAGYISPMYTVFRIDHSINPMFLYILLKTETYLEKYSSLGKGSIDRRKSVKFKDLSNIEIPLPEPSEQNEIVAILNGFNIEIKKLEVELEKNKGLQKSIRQKLHELKNG